VTREERVEAARENDGGCHQHLGEERPPRLGLPRWQYHCHRGALSLHLGEKAGDEGEWRVRVGSLLPEVLAKRVHRRAVRVRETGHVPGKLRIQARREEVEGEWPELAIQPREKAAVKHPVRAVPTATAQTIGAIVLLARYVRGE
jgi:hypothetical protein